MDITVTHAEKRGPIFIGIGLVVVLAAHLFAEIPLATAIALIGLGATQTLARQNDLLRAANLLVYATLVVLTIASQWNLHQNVTTLADAVLAIALLAAAIFHP